MKVVDGSDSWVGGLCLFVTVCIKGVSTLSAQLHLPSAPPLPLQFTSYETVLIGHPWLW